MDHFTVSIETVEEEATRVVSKRDSRVEAKHPNVSFDDATEIEEPVKRTGFLSPFSKEGWREISRPTVSRLSSYATVLSVRTADDETMEKYRDGPKQSWNHPRENMYKLFAAYFEFFVHGLKDSSIGVLMASLQNYYHVTHLVISLAFLSPFVGYTIGACINDRLHRGIGRWGVCIVGVFFQLIFYICAAAKAPFPLFVICYGISGIGSGIIEGGFNAWVGGLNHSPQVLGVLHSLYGLGGMVCPLIGNAMLSKGIEFNFLYVFIVACSCLSLIFIVITFIYESPARYRAQNPFIGHDGEISDDTAKTKSSLSLAFKFKLVWFLSFTLFLYVGAEVTLGGWITTYMVQVIHQEQSGAEYVDTGYWAGIALGRFCFAFLTGYIGHWEWVVAGYMGVCVFLAVINLALKTVASAAACFSLLGLFIGPLFPTMMAVATSKLPKYVHVSGLGFSAALGGAGTAVIPFVTGVLVQTFGAVCVPRMILACLATILCTWLVIIKVC